MRNRLFITLIFIITCQLGYSLNNNKIVSTTEDCNCYKEYSPVCYNGITYENSCEANCAGAKYSEITSGICNISVFIHSSSLSEKQKLRPGGPVGMLVNTVYQTSLTLNKGDVLYFEVEDGNKLMSLYGNGFPEGSTSNLNNGKIISEEGVYVVSYNIETNEYSFSDYYNVEIAEHRLKQVDKYGNYEVQNVTFDKKTTLLIKEMGHGDDIIENKAGSGFPKGETIKYYPYSDNYYISIPPDTYNIYYNTETKKYRFEESENLSIEKHNVKADYFYPNPVSEGVIYFTSSMSVQLFDIKGQLLINALNVNFIDVSRFDKGFYFLKTDKSDFSKIIIK